MYLEKKEPMARPKSAEILTEEPFKPSGCIPIYGAAPALTLRPDHYELVVTSFGPEGPGTLKKAVESVRAMLPDLLHGEALNIVRTAKSLGSIHLGRVYDGIYSVRTTPEIEWGKAWKFIEAVKAFGGRAELRPSENQTERYV